MESGSNFTYIQFTYFKHVHTFFLNAFFISGSCDIFGKLSCVTMAYSIFTLKCHMHSIYRLSYLKFNWLNLILWLLWIHMWHFQVEIGSLWDREYKAWTNVTTFLLVTHIQLESVTYVFLFLIYIWAWTGNPRSLCWVYFCSNFLYVFLNICIVLHIIYSNLWQWHYHFFLEIQKELIHVYAIHPL